MISIQQMQDSPVREQAFGRNRKANGDVKVGFRKTFIAPTMSEVKENYSIISGKSKLSFGDKLKVFGDYLYLKFSEMAAPRMMVLRGKNAEEVEKAAKEFNKVPRLSTALGDLLLSWPERIIRKSMEKAMKNGKKIKL